MTVDVEEFRLLLLEERRRLGEAIEYLHEENPGSLEDESAEMPLDNHLAETATVTFDRELDYTLEENAEQALRQIDAALARIEEGTFGVCRTCGGPIAVERLRAIPHAAQCIDCKRRDERG